MGKGFHVEGHGDDGDGVNKNDGEDEYNGYGSGNNYEIWIFDRVFGLGVREIGVYGGVILILVLSSTQTSVSSSSFLSIRISFLLFRWFMGVQNQ